MFVGEFWLALLPLQSFLMQFFVGELHGLGNLILAALHHIRLSLIMEHRLLFLFHLERSFKCGILGFLLFCLAILALSGLVWFFVSCGEKVLSTTKPVLYAEQRFSASNWRLHSMLVMHVKPYQTSQW